MTQQPNRPRRGILAFFGGGPERPRAYPSAFGSSAGQGFQHGPARRSPRRMEL